MKRYLLGLAALLVLWACPARSPACTTIVFQDDDALFFAWNLDWNWDQGLIVSNPRGITKTALVRPGEIPARWISKYGSATFNQFGRELPYGGINEAGLVVGQMMLLATQYPQPDQRPAVNMLQWIQYQLDTCRTVEEVIDSDREIRVELPRGDERIHYLLCDADGNVATVEFLDGRLACHQGDALPITALTNDCYGESARFAREHAGLGGTNPSPPGRESLHRYTRAALCSRNFRSRTPAADRDACFQALREVAQGDRTMWSVVYDVHARTVYYRTGSHADLRWFALDDLPLSNRTTPQYLDLCVKNQGHVGDQFQPLTEQFHLQFLKSFFQKPDVQRQFGDMTPVADGITMLLRTYRPAIDVVTEQGKKGVEAPRGVGALAP